MFDAFGHHSIHITQTTRILLLLHSIKLKRTEKGNLRNFPARCELPGSIQLLFSRQSARVTLRLLDSPIDAPQGGGGPMHWLLIGYMYLFIHRPFEIWTVIGDYHLERIYMLFTMGVWALYPNKRWIPNRQQIAYFLFASAVVVCWALSPWMDEGQLIVENWFKVLIFFYLLVTVVHDEKSLKKMVAAYLAIMAFYLLHSFREYLGGRHTHRMGTVRMIGVDASMGDPNTFGSSILYSLPMVMVFWTQGISKRRKLMLAGYVGLAVMCLLLTGSRSSLCGLLVLTLILIGKSQKLWTYLFLATISAPLIYMVLPENIQRRFETIIDPESGPANAQESAEGRIQGFTKGIELWSMYPLSGCGPGSWRPATGLPIEAHNLFGQLVGEMGTIGLIAFGSVLVCFWINVRQMKRWQKKLHAPPEDFLFRLSRGIGIMIFLMVFMGTFGHNLFRFNWLWFGGFLIVAHYCVRVRMRRMVTVPMTVTLPSLRVTRPIAG